MNVLQQTHSLGTIDWQKKFLLHFYILNISYGLNVTVHYNCCHHIKNIKYFIYIMYNTYHKIIFKNCKFIYCDEIIAFLILIFNLSISLGLEL